MQFRPGLRAGTEHQQTHRFAAVAQGQDKQAGTTILSAVGIAHQGPRSIVDLGFFPGGGLDHRAGFRRGLPQQTADEALDALIATGEAAAIDQILPDGLGVAALRESQLDGFLVGLAETRRWPALRFPRCRRLSRRFCARVGGHLIGTTGRFCRLRIGGYQVGWSCRYQATARQP